MRLPCGCPDAWPAWDGTDVDLSLHPAHVLPFPTLFHMPLSYDLYRQKQRDELDQLELHERWPGLVFSETGFFGGRLIALLESADSPSRHVQCLPGSLRITVREHDGGVGTITPTVRKLQSDLLDRGRMPNQLWLAHLTCPKCQTDRGFEKILIARRWEPSTRLSNKKPR